MLCEEASADNGRQSARADEDQAIAPTSSATPPSLIRLKEYHGTRDSNFE